MVYKGGVVLDPTPEERRNGDLEELLYWNDKPFVAGTEKAATLRIWREFEAFREESGVADLERVRVILLPLA